MLIKYFTFIFLFSLEINAQSMCADLFIRSEHELHITNSMQQKMKALNYTVADKKLFKGSVLIGDLKVIQPKYLFEWADKVDHDYWVKNGKYTKNDMDYTLSQDAQAYGRGYYVSLNPADSTGYGTHLTIFKLNAPMIILDSLPLDIYDNQIILNELRKIGFAGNRATTTWLNIFNEKVLSEAVKLNLKIVNDLVIEFPASVARLESQGKIPANYLQGIIKKISLNSELNPTEKIMLSAFLEISPNKIFDQIRILKSTDRMMTRIFRNMDHKTIDKLNQMLSYDNINFIFSSVQKNSKVYGFLQLFDLFDIAMIENKNMKEPLSYKEMQGSAQNYSQALDTIELSRITTPRQFIQASRKAFELKLEVRNYDVVMSSHQKTKGHTIPLSEHTYTKLLRNKLLSSTKIKDFTSENSRYIDAEVTYAGIENFKQLKQFFTSAEIKNIYILITKNTAKSKQAATQLVIDKMLAHFFNPKSFDELCKLIGANKSAHSLYKAFVSLHPFGDGNGRSARLYYKWLVENHFPNENSFVLNLVNDYDIFEDTIINESVLFRSWLLPRLWVIAARNEVEMIARAKLILQKDRNHSVRVHQLLDLKDLLK